MLKFVLEGLDKLRHYGYLATIDFPKAFDRVKHFTVISKLIHLGVRRSIIPIICSFLTQRTQCTILGGHISPPLTVSCGVPQGTKLGPILFLALVNDAASDSLRRWKYVANLTLGEVIAKNQSPVLQNHLDSISDWCRSNDVLPKPPKCNVMSLSFLRQMVPQTNFTPNGVHLNVVTHFRLLGIVIQSDLKWGLHVSEIVSKASRRLYTLCILKRSGVPIQDMVTVYKTYIRPILEYASPVWHTTITQSQSKTIEFVQKRAVQIMLGKKYNYDEALCLINLPSLLERRTAPNSWNKTPKFHPS